MYYLVQSELIRKEVMRERLASLQGRRAQIPHYIRDFSVKSALLILPFAFKRDNNSVQDVIIKKHLSYFLNSSMGDSCFSYVPLALLMSFHKMNISVLETHDLSCIFPPVTMAGRMTTIYFVHPGSCGPLQNQCHVDLVN